MTQEDKELLLKDLCSMLPYGVKVRCIGIPKNPYYDHTEIDGDFELLSVCPKKGMATIEHYGNYNLLFTCCIPYLRPMSSMTMEEHKEYEKWLPDEYCIDTFDWLNAHYFDYRGLIGKGLALVAPDDMYKTE